MKWFLPGLTIANFLLLSATNIFSQDTYFPQSNASNLMEIAKNLIMVNEPSLSSRILNPKQFSYREIRRQYHNNIMLIRLDIEADKSGTLTYKKISHSKLIENRQTSINIEEGQWFLMLFEKCQFMSIPIKKCDPIDTDMITVISDGIFSIYEGVMDGNYHMFTRVEYDLTPIEDEHFQEMRYYFVELCERML